MTSSGIFKAMKDSIMLRNVFFCRTRFVFLFYLCLAFTVNFVSAQKATSLSAFPSVEPLFLYDDGGSFDDDDIIKAALEFSECPLSSAQGQAAFSRYVELRSMVTGISFMELGQSERAEKILSLMYEKVIGSYKERQTRMNLLFEDGSYNCVSSSVLYLALAKASGLDVRGQLTPNHAFCTLYVSDGSGGGKAKIDVETTNPYGFNPGVKRPLQEDASHGGKYTVVPKRNYSGRHEVDDRMFVSLVGGNVASDYDKAENWQMAVPMSAACLEFTRGEQASFYSNRTEFEKLCTNYVVSLQREKQYGRVLEWLDLVLARWGAGNELENTYEKSVSNYIIALCRTGSFSAAKECLDQRREKISMQAQVRFEQMIFDNEVQWHLDASSDDDAAIAYLQEVRSMDMAKSTRNAAKVRQRLEYHWLNKINAAQKEGDFLYAASIADKGMECVPGSSVLLNAKKACFRNYDASYHNKFADLANKKRYEEALDVLNEGLSGNPESQVLKGDLKRLQGMMNKR